MLFQYQAGPRSSYRLSSSSSNGAVWANCGGSAMTGVSADSGAVRSTTSTRPLVRASASVDRMDIDVPRAWGQQRRQPSRPPRPGGAGAASEQLLGLGEGVPQDLLHLVELRLPADQRRGDLDDDVAAGVGPAGQAVEIG